MQIRSFITSSFILAGSIQLQTSLTQFLFLPTARKNYEGTYPHPSLLTPLSNPFLEERNKFPPNTYHWETTSVRNEFYGVGKPFAWEPTVLVDVLQEGDKDNYLVPFNCNNKHFNIGARNSSFGATCVLSYLRLCQSPCR